MLNINRKNITEGEDDVSIILQPCSDPFCECGNSYVGLKINSLAEKNLINDHLVFNHFDQSVELFDPASSLSPERIDEITTFAVSLEEQFTDQDWDAIEDEHLLLKQEIIENYDPHSSVYNYSFEKELMEQPNLMAFFIDIHPYAHVPEITHNGETYQLIDQHCKSPDCPCSSIVMTVMNKDASVGDNFIFRYNYKTGELEDKSKQWVLDLLTKDKPIQYYNDLFAKRNKKVRELYLLDLKRNPRTIKKKKTKIGRNDKCPCGSGLKYKKCCIGL